MKNGRQETTSYFEFGNSSKPATPSSGFRLYAFGNSALGWVGTDGFTRAIGGGTLTGDRTYALQDQSGTIALLSDTGSVAGQVVFPGLISPTDVGTLNDWAPTGFSSAYRINWNGASGAIVTGLSGGTVGRRVMINNITAAQVLCLVTGSALSASANRFNFTQLGKSNHLYVFPGEALELVYGLGAWNGNGTVGLRNLNNNLVGQIYRQVAGSGTAPINLGLIHTSGGGTISTTTPASTSVRMGLARTTGDTGATAGTQTGTRSQGLVFRGAVVNGGGFHVNLQFLFGATSANASFFVGLFNSAAPGNVNASTLLNQVGFQVDPAETTLRIGSNDGTGAATRVDLGANFPINTTVFYECHLFASANSSSIQYAIHRLDDLTILPAIGSITTDLPTGSQLLALHVWGCNRTDAVSNTIAWGNSTIRIP
jgi:hypothetical protein